MTKSAEIDEQKSTEIRNSKTLQEKRFFSKTVKLFESVSANHRVMNKIYREILHL